MSPPWRSAAVGRVLEGNWAPSRGGYCTIGDAEESEDGWYRTEASFTTTCVGVGGELMLEPGTEFRPDAAGWIVLEGETAYLMNYTD